MGTAQTLEEMVRQFHDTYGLAIRDTPTTSVPEKQLRIDLIDEEFTELKKALDGNDIVETADAIADMLYVVMGAALTFGIPIQEVLEEVQRSNMSKLDRDGSVIRRGDGKILKGPDYFPPDIPSVLEKHQRATGRAHGNAAHQPS